nr:primosomal protein N' [uncultured Friedmanniella sp.]
MEPATALPPPHAPAEVRPVGRVVLDLPLSHLDRPFDYAVSRAQDAEAVPGARVRVRFAGKQRDGFLLERRDGSDHDGTLSPLSKVVSAEPVLTPEVARLVRAVADHYAGSFSDVMRLAVPPRHAATEKAAPAPSATTELPEPPPHALDGYPTGPGFLAALASGASARAAWQVTPSAALSGDWASGFAAAARAAVESGRGAVLVVPDQRDVEQLQQACKRALGTAGFAVLVAEAGPAARYRAFLRALRGEVKVVIGNRAAAFAPVRDLGLVALWDDGDDLLAEPRAPYPHAREVLALRAAQQGSAALFAGYARTAEVHGWVEQGWLRELAEDRVVLRHTAPQVKVSADSDQALERDPAARAARLPHEVFTLMRSVLPQGPVLVQVPRAGYLVALVCQDCREPARCRHCGGPTRAGRDRPGQAVQAACSWCGRLQVDWECPICGSHRFRAPVVGSERTAEELGKAFPGTPVRQSSAGQVAATVPAAPAIVVATPGAEPRAQGGYAGAVLLDTSLLLLRADLRASEEALRRWLNAVALVRSGGEGGSVIAVGESSGRALQALVRVDPAGLAARELVDRAEAHFPPAAKLVTVEGRPEALAEFVQLAALPPHAEVLGPVALSPDRRPGDPIAAASEPGLSRLTLRAPRSEGAALVRAVKDVSSIRSARKSEGALRIRVDPVAIG